MTRIDNVLAFANSQVGVPYSAAPVAPNSYDCSSFTEACYANANPGAAIGRTTVDQWNNGVPVFDALAQDSAIPPQNLLAPGDLIFFGTNHQVGGDSAHVQMFVGAGRVISAPHSGSSVGYSNLDLSGAGEPGNKFAGIVRFIALDGNTPLVKGNSPGVVGTGTNQAATGGSAGPTVATDFGQAVSIPDPRDNRPFSPFFFSSGDLSYIPPNSNSTFSPGRELIHGGMAEILDTPRPGGPLACYFMLNPTSISSGYTFNGLAPQMTQLIPGAQAIAALPMSNLSISFTLIFNRMYEVWNGDYTNINDGIGPSDVGVRWDIRALERLAGLLDDTTGATGVSKLGPGQGSPVGHNLQVVFGGSNSFQFQGIMQALSVTYTRFSRDMVPTEATADIQMLQIFNPGTGNTAGDLSNNLLINLAPGTSGPPPIQFTPNIPVTGLR